MKNKKMSKKKKNSFLSRKILNKNKSKLKILMDKYNFLTFREKKNCKFKIRNKIFLILNTI